MFFSFGILLKNLANRQTYFAFKKASFLSEENLFYLEINRKNNITIKLLNKKTLKHYFCVFFFSTTINIFFQIFFLVFQIKVVNLVRPSSINMTNN